MSCLKLTFKSNGPFRVWELNETLCRGQDRGAAGAWPTGVAEGPTTANSHEHQVGRLKPAKPAKPARITTLSGIDVSPTGLWQGLSEFCNFMEVVKVQYWIRSSRTCFRGTCRDAWAWRHHPAFNPAVHRRNHCYRLSYTPTHSTNLPKSIFSPWPTWM